MFPNDQMLVTQSLPNDQKQIFSHFPYCHFHNCTLGNSVAVIATSIGILGNRGNVIHSFSILLSPPLRNIHSIIIFFLQFQQKNLQWESPSEVCMVFRGRVESLSRFPLIAAIKLLIFGSNRSQLGKVVFGWINVVKRKCRRKIIFCLFYKESLFVWDNYEQTLQLSYF